MPVREQVSHKGTFGRVLNIAGSDYMSGAAYLSSVAALKIGCGYVFLCSTEKAMNAVSSQTQNIVFCPFDELKQQINNADVVLIGCGISTNEQARKNIFVTIKNIGDKPILIDADGINIISENPDTKFPTNLILTPHPKEAARLLKVDVSEILSDIEGNAKEISKKYNCVTVLKSHNTVVCSKDFEIYINNTGNSALAKAGSGDVLAGMIAGLLAQKMDLYEAAKLGVYLHGLSGEIASQDLTEYSVLAKNQIDYLPQAIKTLL